MIYSLLSNLDFLSALSGLAGTVLIFFFGLPSRINEKGAICLALEQTDEKAVKDSKIYKKAGYLGLVLVALSFLIQLVKIGFNLQ